MPDQDAPNESPITTNGFSLTPKAYLRIWLHIQIWKLWGLFLLPGVVTFYLIAYKYSQSCSSREVIPFALVLIPFALFLPVFLYCYGRYLTHHKSSKVVMKSRFMIFEKNKVKIMVIETDSESVGVYKNEEFYRAETLKDCYLLYITPIQFFYLPKNAFRDENDRARFEKEILPRFQPLKRTLWKGIFLFLILVLFFVLLMSVL